ncbi:GFA family protein [Fusibacter ferrireducens]|uniref:GFA family protein n=1 Tax=Fusibacter ferrireducens TaxID=2785058 RepID=A0ABR9ZNH6_9FIRM|nr:GFA family protein [Fusibacter ferrireducens]MBF4692012.1 GFA family protein [Fusibacter ferrireducens]
MEYLGSCLCKSVKFKITGEFEDFYLCHCKYCRKDSGSAHAANLFSTHAELIWLKGKEHVKTYQLEDTNHVKGFCSICGSALPNLQMDGSLVVVPAGSLDSKLDKKPDGHIFMSNKANWDESLENVDKYERFPTKDK